MIPYHAVLYMQTPYDSLSFSALYAKCPYVLVLYMQSALFLSALHANLSGGGGARMASRAPAQASCAAETSAAMNETPCTLCMKSTK